MIMVSVLICIPKDYFALLFYFFAPFSVVLTTMKFQLREHT